jgi:glucose/arabinose dehydrogenase
MTRILIGLLALIAILYGALILIKPSAAPVDNTGAATTTPTVESISIVAENLEIPWDIAFLPDNTLLVTERTGDVLAINPSTGERSVVLSHSPQNGEGGLLGILLHPDYAQNSYVYLYMTAPGARDETINRVIRYTYVGGKLTKDKDIIGDIPGATYHDGGRMEFGPDGKLYITTGDATRAQIAQDKSSLGGKILRLNDDGSIPSDNPFGTAVWSYGHRNPQGLAWDASGNLWETEHGPTGEDSRCCHDELNLLTKGGNFGWPTIIGDETKNAMTAPVRHSGDDTWAPASLAYLDGALYFGGLKGEAIYKATISGDTISSLTEHFVGDYGRIRTIRVGPDNMLYITTSNRDGRGARGVGDDKILRIDPAALK